MPVQNLALPRLMIVSSGTEHPACSDLAVRQARALSKAGPVIYQLREKRCEAGTIHDLCCTLAHILSDSGSLLSVNERFDIALASGAGGIHLPESSCPPDVIRKKAQSLLLGQSVHHKASAIRAAEAGIDYILFGPVFQTPSKRPFGPPQGLQKLQDVCRSVTVPVFAVGGITPERAFACIEYGAWGVAALAPFLDTDRLPETLNHYQSFLHP
jgi:thiamine-phosphate pyrophosphorylase